MQEKLSKLKYKFKTEVKSGKSGYMLYAAVLAGILCIAVLKTGGKEQSQTQTIVLPDYTDSADNIELEVLAEGEEKPFLVELEVSPRQYDAQQIEGIFDTVYEQILQEMVSGNESLFLCAAEFKTCDRITGLSGNGRVVFRGYCGY